MGKRENIMAAAYTALDNSTNTNYVTRDYSEDGYNLSDDKYPGVKMWDEEGDKNRLSFLSATTTVDDMEATFFLVAEGYARATNSSTALRDAATALTAGIELALTTSTGILDLVADITPEGDETDREVLEGISRVRNRYRVWYFYPHLSP